MIGAIYYCLAILGPLSLLQWKHQIVDWMWQPEYEYKNKGTFGHFGGIRHAGKNAIGTGLCIGLFYGGPIGLLVTVLDFMIHYTIDLCKTKINNHYALDPTKHKEYFWLLGLDQTLHQLTYIFLVFVAFLIKFL